MTDFVLVRASGLRRALSCPAMDGMGYFILWIMERAENLKTNSGNIISIPNKKAASQLNVTQRTIIKWKQALIEKGIISKVKGQSLFRLNPRLIYKGKMKKE